MQARDDLLAVRASGDIEADDLMTLAQCAWFLGDMDGALAAFEEAHHRYLRDRVVGGAAMAAVYLAAHTSQRGDVAIGSGWMRRAHRLLEGEPGAAEHGYLRYFELFAALGRQDYAAALAHARVMHELGTRFTDPNLVALGVVGEGLTLVKLGRVAEGMALLDEAMPCSTGASAGSAGPRSSSCKATGTWPSARPPRPAPTCWRCT